MIYRTKPDDIESYYNSSNMNQSALKIILQQGVQSFIAQQQEVLHTDELYYEEKEHFLIGKAVDCLLTEGEDVFKERYFWSKMTKKPTDVEMSIIKMVFDNAIMSENELLDSSEEEEGKEDIWKFATHRQHIYEACDYHKYYMNRRRPTAKDIEENPNFLNWYEIDNSRFSALTKSGLTEAYWNELIAADGKQILSDKQYTLIQMVYQSFITHKHTAFIFSEEDEDVDTIYQLPMYFNFEGVECKILPDIIRIKHSTRKIMPIDGKTIGKGILKFCNDFTIRRYDIQGAFYDYGIRQNLGIISNLIRKDIRDYEISNFAFIVESTVYPGTPMIFPMSDDLMVIGKQGDNEGKKLGWLHAIKLYQKWRDSSFSLDKMVEPTNGILWLVEGLNGEITYNQIL